VEWHAPTAKRKQKKSSKGSRVEDLVHSV